MEGFDTNSTIKTYFVGTHHELPRQGEFTGTHRGDSKSAHKICSTDTIYFAFIF